MVLHLTKEKPRHGYGVIRSIEDLTRGAYAPSPGLVYPTLASLERAGDLEVLTSRGARRLYALSSVGRTRLDGEKAKLDAALGRLDSLRRANSPLDCGPVRRAVQSLESALEDRLLAQDDKQLALDIAELIDDAVRKIERL
ncbi:PadR family transcriptional regulator [Bradyrhizobium sp. HKCCYLRH1065]|uniref:PadR family transcriptional regulator n=1 Tax=Bradyrhizobium sp. HKCCYLRH1065 TaxID=3420753 RepID=UPI003EBE9907